MLNCAATRRSRDKKPGDNKLDIRPVVTCRPITAEDFLKFDINNEEGDAHEKEMSLVNYINGISLTATTDIGELSPLSAVMRTETAG